MENTYIEQKASEYLDAQPVQLMVYRKKEIVHKFYPEIPVNNARRRMNSAISGDRTLCEKLKKTGFFNHRTSKYYTTPELILLKRYIGVPLLKTRMGYNVE